METDYLNFLKTFYQEELFLVDSVETDGPAAPAQESAAEKVEDVDEASIEIPWQSAGPVESPLAFILDEKASKALPDEISERFSTMLSRLNLGTEQVLIVNRQGETGQEIEQKIMGLMASKIILLGRDGIFADLQPEDYKAVRQGEKFFLMAPSFSEIIRDKTQVKMFWDAMVGLLK